MTTHPQHLQSRIDQYTAQYKEHTIRAREAACNPAIHEHVIRHGVRLLGIIAKLKKYQESDLLTVRKCQLN